MLGSQENVNPLLPVALVYTEESYWTVNVGKRVENG